MPKTVEIMMISNWGKPSEPTKAIPVSANIGVNPQPWNGRGRYAVCHLPTGAAIRPNLSKSEAMAIARELAKEDSKWNFQTEQQFKSNREVSGALVRIAAAKVFA